MKTLTDAQFLSHLDQGLKIQNMYYVTILQAENEFSVLVYYHDSSKIIKHIFSYVIVKHLFSKFK